MKGQFLKSIRDVEVAGKNVLVRADLEWSGENLSRERAAREIVKYLQDKGAGKIKVIGHKGRFENDLRKDPREEMNDVLLADELADGWDVYVNEAFATSHRKHCSVDALPRLMVRRGKEVCAGLRFEEEIEMLAQATSYKLQATKILVIGGAKVSDKARYADEFEKQGWTVLRGGLLPGVKLRPDGLDISDETIGEYKNKIAGAGTIVVAGPMGKYGVAEKGTKEVFTAVANSQAYKVAGGGDTEAALGKFGLLGKFDWVSVGGGAMLEYLATRTLPGIEALRPV